MRPNAPQNNPANVSANGGNGQSGTQAPKYIPGMAALGSSGVETMAQQQGAPMSGGSSPQPQGLPELSPLTAESQLPDQPITDGAPIGDGANSVANLPMGVSEDPDVQSARDHLPIIEWWASQPGATQSTKDYASYLRTALTNPIPGALA
jgi:hypothetical protein